MRPFRAVSSLAMNGLAAKVHSDSEVVVATGGRLTVDQARALRDWLTRVLPCEHLAGRTGIWSGTEPLRMKCDVCGEDVPLYAITAGWGAA